MSNSFCRYLTNGLRVQSWHGSLASSPCCYIPQILHTDPAFDEKFSQLHKLSHCGECINQVNGNTSSPKYPPNRSKQLVPDVDHTHPIYVELSIDNKCNAACLSCNDGFSTLWEEQNKKFNVKISSEYPDAQNNEQVVENLFNQFNFDYVTNLNFLGGEPLISRANALVMERLINRGISKNIRLIFTTNGSTHLTNKQIDILAQFSSIDFVYSVDGVGDRFQYLRYPLKWQKFLSVIESVKENTKIKTKFHINMTINPLNAFYIDEVENWANNYFKNDERFTGISTPGCTGVMSISALPAESRRKLSIKHFDNTNLLYMFRNASNPTATGDFVNHLKFWDHCRNLNWQETFPEAVPYFAEYLK